MIFNNLCKMMTLLMSTGRGAIVWGVNMIILISKKTVKYISLVIATVVVLSFSFAILLSAADDVFEQTPADNNSYTARSVPIIMYHSIMKKSSQFGKYVITDNEFEKDISYLKEHGYTSINMTELINFVYGGSELPDKPVIITFDDGNLNNYIYGKPVLEKYGMKAVISIVGTYTESFSKSPPPTEDPPYAFASWSQIKEISDSGFFEIQNHTYNLHLINKQIYGIKKKSGETPENYKERLTSDISKLQDKISEVTGVTPNTFTYPFGYVSKESKDVLKNLGFKATLSCAEGVNIIDRNKQDTLYGLKRKNRPHGISSETFFKNFCP